MTASTEAKMPEQYVNELTITDFRSCMKDLLKESNVEVRKEMDILKERCDVLEGKVHELEVKNEILEKKRKSSDKRIKDLSEKLNARSQTLEDLQQYTRRNYLIITGVPEERGENTDEVVRKLVKDKCDVNVEESDIDTSHRQRIGKPVYGKPRAIVVKFTRYSVKRKIIMARKKLKGTKIGVQGLLTPFSQHLLQRANELVNKAHWIKSAWAWDGRVYVLLQPEGKIPEKVVVRSECDLYDLFYDHAAEHRRRGLSHEETEGLGERNVNKEAEEHKANEGESKEEEEENAVTEDSEEGEDNDS